MRFRSLFMSIAPSYPNLEPSNVQTIQGDMNKVKNYIRAVIAAITFIQMISINDNVRQNGRNLQNKCILRSYGYRAVYNV